MKKLLLSCSMLLGLAGAVSAQEIKIPIELTGTVSGVTVTPLDPKTLEPIQTGEPASDPVYAAKLTTSDDLQNVFQYKGMSTEDAVAQGCDRIVIEFSETAGDAWRFHSYGGQFDNIEEIGGKTSHTLMLQADKNSIEDLTIFNWLGSGSQEITITAMYFCDESKTIVIPIEVAGSHAGVTVVPLDPETLEPLEISEQPIPAPSSEPVYAASFKTNGDLLNVIQYKPMSTENAAKQGCDRIVIEFAGTVGDAWRFHSYGGQFDGIEEIGGKTSHTMMLQGTKAVDDFTIFNWVGSGSQEISIKAAYFYRPAINLSESGYATFGSSYNSVGLTGGTVYTAQYDNGKLKLKAVSDGKIPANVGVIIKGSGEVTSEYGVEAGSVTSDLLVSDGTVEGDGNIYVMTKGGSGVGFYKLGNGVKVPAGKAYLNVNAGGREFIGFAEDATAIKTVETAKTNGAIYNLAGQQVKRAQKGLFIVDGKKVIK